MSYLNQLKAVKNRSKTKVITLANHKRTQTIRWINQNSKELLVVYAKSRKHARSSHNGLSFTFDWMKKWRQLCSVGIFLSKHINFSLHFCYRNAWRKWENWLWNISKSATQLDGKGLPRKQQNIERPTKKISIFHIDEKTNVILKCH